MKSKPNLNDAGDRGKKPYRRPRLRRYGDIRAITRAISHVNMNDMAAHGNPNQKT